MKEPSLYFSYKGREEKKLSDSKSCQTHIFSDVNMVLEVFHHAECAEAVDLEDGFQLGVADGELLVLRVVEVSLLDDGPHALDDLMTGHLILTHDGGQFRGEAAGLGEPGLLLGGGRHDELRAVLEGMKKKFVEETRSWL